MGNFLFETNEWKMVSSDHSPSLPEDHPLVASWDTMTQTSSNSCDVILGWPFGKLANKDYVNIRIVKTKDMKILIVTLC